MFSYVFAYGSLTGVPTNVSTFTNDTNYLDSSTVTGVIDATYIQTNQTSYNTSDFVDSAYVATQISNLVDGAPVALDTLNEIATALQNDSDALASLITVVDTKLNTAAVTSLVDSAYVQLRQTDQDFAYGSLTGAPTIPTLGTDFVDSGQVTAIVDASYIQTNQTSYNTSDFTDSAYVTGLPVSTFTNDANYLDSNTVQGVIDATYIQTNQTTYNTSDFTDSAYVLSVLPKTGTDFADSAWILGQIPQVGVDYADSAFILANGGGLDSALISQLIDSAYVQLRQSGETAVPLIQTLFEFTGDSGQTVFTGNDANANTLTFANDNINVYLNGLILSPVQDYSVSGGDTVTLTTGIDSGAEVFVNTIVGNNIGLDSAEALQLIDATYIQANQTHYLDSALTAQLIDATYIQANQTHYLDSALATQLIDSSYVQLRQTNSFGVAYVSGQDSVVADTVDETIIFEAGNGITLTTDNNTKTVTITNALNAEIAQAIIDSDYISDRIHHTFNVANSGSGYYAFTGYGFPSSVNNPDLYLVRGETYHFVVNASGHPFYINTVSGTGTGNAYSTGVIGNGADTDTVKFTVPMDAPNKLFYNCSNHSAMAGTIYIHNNSAYLDSSEVDAIITALGGVGLDSALALNVIDSAYISGIVDSAYISGLGFGTGSGSGGTDSAAIIQLIDSAYVAVKTVICW